MGAVWCQAQTESDGLLCELCYCMQTLLAGASWPSCLVDGSQRPGGMPLSPGSHAVSGITRVEQHQNPSYECIKRGPAKWALATLEINMCNEGGNCRG